MSDQDPKNSEAPVTCLGGLIYFVMAVSGLFCLLGGTIGVTKAYNVSSDIVGVCLVYFLGLCLLMPTLKGLLGKKRARKARNRGLLAIVGLGFVLSICLPPIPPAELAARKDRSARRAEDRRQQRAEKERLRVEKQEQQQAADAKRKRQRERRAVRGHSDVQELMKNLRKIGVDESVIVRGSYAEIGRSATLTVANSWHRDSYQIRLQAAQNLWDFWVDIHSPDDRDQARIKLVDLNGNEVGGSRLIAGSMIWVTKN